MSNGEKKYGPIRSLIALIVTTLGIGGAAGAGIGYTIGKGQGTNPYNSNLSSENKEEAIQKGTDRYNVNEDEMTKSYAEKVIKSIHTDKDALNVMKKIALDAYYRDGGNKNVKFVDITISDLGVFQFIENKDGFHVAKRTSDGDDSRMPTNSVEYIFKDEEGNTINRLIYAYDREKERFIVVGEIQNDSMLAHTARCTKLFASTYEDKNATDKQIEERKEELIGELSEYMNLVGTSEEFFLTNELLGVKTMQSTNNNFADTIKVDPNSIDLEKHTSTTLNSDGTVTVDRYENEK